MADTTYTTGVTAITADTMNDLNRLHYTILSDPADAAAVATAIGALRSSTNPTLVSLEGLSLAAGDILYATAADTLQRLPKGTGSQNLRMNSGATAPEWVTSILTSGTAVASTSGTSIDFTGIPAGTKQIDIMFASVSTSGTSNPLIQLGDSGGVEITGYLGSNFDGVTIVGGIVDGFRIPTANAAASMHGLITLRLLNAATFSWVASGTIGRSDGNGITFFSGSKILSAELDRVRITTVNGTDTFDAGVINITYS